jgi:phospholipid/cholesterol/gamma-HCH transport system substrate-binding protein
MVQSKSSKESESATEEQKDSRRQGVPPRSFSLEFFVGLFTIFGLLAVAYLAVGLGGLKLFAGTDYEIHAEFDNIAGLRSGASVEVAGVPVGSVAAITLKDPMAVVTMRIGRDFRVRDDDIASIRTKGIIGDRYIKISRGGSDIYVEPGGWLMDTESVVDIEDLIGKFVHSLGDDK